jgi:hypothetical protein
MTKREITTTCERDIGIDCVRALALVLMVSIHFSRVVPDFTFVARALKFVGESAPAFFFFAFGLTLHRFFQKTGKQPVQVLRLFLYLAIAQSFMAGKPFQMDFFLFLWIWQGLLFIAYRKTARMEPALFLLGAGTLILQMVLPLNYLRADVFLGSPFPLLPWGLFVFCGILSAPRIDSPRLPVAGVGMVLLSAGLFVCGRALGLPQFAPIKEPMTATWFLGFFGIILLVLWRARKIGGRLKTKPRTLGIIRLLSQNLLLGTVLHYAAYLTCKAGFLAISYHGPEAVNALIRRFDFLSILLGSAIAVVLLVIFLKGTLAFYHRPKIEPVFSWFAQRFDLVGIAGVFAVGFLYALAWFSNQTPAHVLFRVGTLLIMILLALVMKHQRKENVDF